MNRKIHLLDIFNGSLNLWRNHKYYKHPTIQVGCPKYSKHLIFDLIWTFRILRIQDLNIFELWISVFASIRFGLRIFRISRIYSTPWLGLIYFFKYETITHWVPTFFLHNKLVLARVSNLVYYILCSTQSQDTEPGQS